MKLKNKKGEFLSMLIRTLGAILLGNMLAGKGVIRAGEGTTRVGNGSKRFSFKKIFDPTRFFPPHPFHHIKMNLDLMGFILEIISLIK